MKNISLALLVFLFGCTQKKELPFVVNNKIILSDTTKEYYYPKGIIVNKTGILEVKPGVKIAFGKVQNLIVFGTLIAQGTSTSPIKFFAQDSLFNRIVFKAGSKNNIISFANIIDGTIGIEKTNLKLIHINMYFNIPRGTDIAWPVIYSKLGNIEIHNTYITNKSNGWVGEGFVALGGKTNIFDSGIMGIPDAIEFTQVENGRINSVIITGSGDDGIDLNSCQNISIQNAVIKNVTDKAITIGGAYHFTEIIDSLPIMPSRNISVSNCYINGAGIGISVKDSSTIKISDCVFENCKTAFQVIEKNKNQGSGFLSTTKSVVFKYNSFLNISEGAIVNFSSLITDKKEPLVNSNFLFPEITITEADFKNNFSFDSFLKQKIGK